VHMSWCVMSGLDSRFIALEVAGTCLLVVLVHVFRCVLVGKWCLLGHMMTLATCWAFVQLCHRDVQPTATPWTDTMLGGAC